MKDLLKGDKKQEVSFSAGMFVTDVVGDTVLLSSIAKTAATSGFKIVLKESFDRWEVKNLPSENLSSGEFNSTIIDILY